MPVTFDMDASSKFAKTLSKSSMQLVFSGCWKQFRQKSSLKLNRSRIYTITTLIATCTKKVNLGGLLV